MPKAGFDGLLSLGSTIILTHPSQVASMTPTQWGNYCELTKTGPQIFP